MRAWDNFLLLQEIELGVDAVEKWLRPLKVLRYDACNLYLEAQDSFQITWFNEHLKKKVQTKLVNNNNKQIKIHLSLPNEPEQSDKGRRIKRKVENEPKIEFSLSFDELDPNCTFDRFITTEGNILTSKLLCKITNYDPISQKYIQSDTDLASFNPIYVHGPEGTGKTHLLMATAHALRAQGLNVIYIRTETFTDHVVSAIRAGEMSMFRQAYRNIDVLLIDDAHLFSRKGATQEELFHTFNTLHLAGKQIILSSNCSPSELQHIEPRLVSRFEWGIVLPLEALKREELERILLKKSEALNFEIHPKVSTFLLETFSQHPKSLMRALEALILRSHMDQHPADWAYKKVTIPYTKQTIADLIEEEQEVALDSQKIIQIVSKYYGIHTDDLLGKGQNREFAMPRQMAMYFCRQKLKHPYQKIGDLFDRDHSTVMSSVKLIRKGVEEDDRELLSHINQIEKNIGGI